MMSRKIAFGIDWMLLISYACMQYSGYCNVQNGTPLEYSVLDSYDTPPSPDTYDTTSSPYTYDITTSPDTRGTTTSPDTRDTTTSHNINEATVSDDECIGMLHRYW